MRPGRIVAVGAIAGALVVAVPTLVKLSRDALRLASSQYSLNPQFAAFTRLSAGESACLSEVFLPTTARSATVIVLPLESPSGTPRLRLRARERGAASPLFTRDLPPTVAGGATVARLPRAAVSRWPVTLCVENPSTRAVLVADNDYAAYRPDAPPGSLRPRIDLYQGRAQSGFQMLPTAVRRASLFKAGIVTPGLIWLALVIALLLPLVGVVVFRGEVGRSR